MTGSATTTGSTRSGVRDGDGRGHLAGVVGGVAAVGVVVEGEPQLSGVRPVAVQVTAHAVDQPGLAGYRFGGVAAGAWGRASGGADQHRPVRVSGGGAVGADTQVREVEEVVRRQERGAKP